MFTSEASTEVNLDAAKIARWSAWMLLLAAIVLVVSGWGITHTEIIYNASFGLVDRKLANYIHRLSNIVFVVFFLSHVLIRIKLSLSNRFSSRIRLINIIAVMAGVGLLVLVFYMELFA